MMFKTLITTNAAAWLALVTVLPAFAQSILGIAEINGRKIVVNDDFTWSYINDDLQAAIPTDCFKITEVYLFCGKYLGWGAYGVQLSPDITAAFKLDDRNYFTTIHETVGANDGISFDFIQDAIIKNTAAHAGLSTKDVTIHSVDETHLFGDPARRIVYSVNLNGLDVTYFNTFYVVATETLQFISYTIGAAPTPQSMQTHTNAIAVLQKR